MAVSDPDSGLHGTLTGALPQQIIVDLPTDEARTAALETLLRQRSERIAAIIIEPLVQGAGGMRFHDPHVLQTLRTLADRYELLLIFDEIFTGFGRTGTMFAFEQTDGADARPDPLYRTGRFCPAVRVDRLSDAAFHHCGGGFSQADRRGRARSRLGF